MSATIADTTLLTEHLSYRPAALIDDIINSVNILAFRATEAVEKGLLNANFSDLGFRIPANSKTPEAQAATHAITESAKHEIENGVHQLETLLETKIDRNFDKLEIVALRSILSVPPEIRDWVQLSHYEGLSFPAGRQDDMPSSESIALQRRKLREMQKLQSLLVAEKAKNDAMITSMKSILTSDVAKAEPDADDQPAYPTLAFLQKKGELTGDASRPVATSTSFAVSQLPALRTLLENLKPRLDELANGDGKQGMVGEEEKSWRRQRLEFVEKETRKHLEDVRGLELGEMGEVRDGEWQGEGRKLGSGEVEDLEKVVSMVNDDQVEGMDQT